MHKRVMRKASVLLILKKYQDIPRKINPSAILSRVESKRAPNLVTLPLTLARIPSRRSKRPPKRIKIPPKKRLKGIIKPEMEVRTIPMNVIMLGLIGKAFAKGARGLSRK